MDLLDFYQYAASLGEITRDKTQIQALSKLQRIVDELEKPRSVFSRILNKRETVRGLYFHGTVGVGKTYLMDLFYQQLKKTKKLRMHFHRFMQEVDSQLRKLQGQEDPLAKVADNIASRARVLCFDEFFVHDIADAMILGRLFKALFNRGITLIATSNIEPDKLYWNGLHRKRFLPTIELIKQQCEIYAFDSNQDYRLRELLQAGVYFYPLNKQAHSQLQNFFTLCAHDKDEQDEQDASVWVENREIPIVSLAEHVVWFEFDVLCNIPRSQLDYIDIAKRFNTVILSNVKQMTYRDNAAITYFINLIDVLYDERVHFIMSAQVDVSQLYTGETKAFEFRRTLSRLTEMQSVEYLEKLPHPMKEAIPVTRLPED